MSTVGKTISFLIVFVLIVWGVSYMGKSSTPAEPQPIASTSNEASVTAVDTSDAGLDDDMKNYDTQLTGLGQDGDPGL